MNRLSNYRPTKALTLLFIATLWLPVMSPAQAGDSAPLSAKVVSVVGSARYSDKNSTIWKAVRIGDEFSAGPALQTNIKDSTADIEVAGSDAGGRAAVRMFTNTLLKMIQLNSKKSGSATARDVRFEVAAGQIRVTLDGVSDYAFLLSNGAISMRVTADRSTAKPQETVFVFGATASLTVLKGAVKASIGSGPERPVRAGEQLRNGADQVTKAPPDAPELKLGQ